MTHDDGGGLSGYVPGGPTQHAGSGEPTGAFSAAGATAHAGSRPWRGPVRALPYPREDAERGPDRPVWYDIEDASGLIVTRCWNRRNADAIAAALNAPAPGGCGCRAWLRDYADRQRCHKGGDTLAKWLEEIAARLPAPSDQPGGGNAKDAELARLREENERLRRLTENALPDAEMERDMAEARVHELDAEVSTLRAALAAAEAKHQQMVQYTADLAWVASGVRFGARQWGRELWLAAWMVAAGGDYLSTEMWTNLLDGLGEARAELERVTAERERLRAKTTSLQFVVRADGLLAGKKGGAE